MLANLKSTANHATSGWKASSRPAAHRGGLLPRPPARGCWAVPHPSVPRRGRAGAKETGQFNVLTSGLIFLSLSSIQVVFFATQRLLSAGFLTQSGAARFGLILNQTIRYGVG